MFCAKKREIHAEEDGSPEDRAEESGEINFAWIVFIGMQVGYREPELAHMYFGKWCDLFEEYKKMHNFKVKRMIFEEKKEVSLLDL